MSESKQKTEQIPEVHHQPQLVNGSDPFKKRDEFVFKHITRQMTDENLAAFWRRRTSPMSRRTVLSLSIFLQDLPASPIHQVQNRDSVSRRLVHVLWPIARCEHRGQNWSSDLKSVSRRKIASNE